MRYWVFVAAWLGVLSPRTSLEAQRPISIGVGGGVSIPDGDFDDAVNAGWHALVTASIGSPMHPWGARLDLAYSRFGFSEQAVTAFGGQGHQTTGSATLNFTYRLPKVTSPVSPYLLWGIGAYRTDCSLGPNCESRVRYGWNYGLGARFFFLGF